MLWTSLGLVPVTLAPVALGLLGSIYLAVAIGMNLWFVASVVRLLRERTDEAGRRVSGNLEVEGHYLGLGDHLAAFSCVDNDRTDSLRFGCRRLQALARVIAGIYK